jgi:hypothetical protein
VLSGILRSGGEAIRLPTEPDTHALDKDLHWYTLRTAHPLHDTYTCLIGVYRQEEHVLYNTRSR